MLRVLLSLQSKFSESTTLLKGYEMLIELSWSWPAKQKQKTHKHICDMIRWQFRYERLVCWQGNHEGDSRIRNQRLPLKLYFHTVHQFTWNKIIPSQHTKFHMPHLFTFWNFSLIGFNIKHNAHLLLTFQPLIDLRLFQNCPHTSGIQF